MVSRVNPSGKPSRQNFSRDDVPECSQVLHPPNQVGRYIFYSSPKPVSTVRPGYRNQIAKPRGIHDYYNMMWDPHVYRGDSFKSYAAAERERSDAEAKKEERRRKLRNLLVSPTKKIGGINRPGTPSHLNDKRKNMNTQTVKFLEDFGEEPRALECETQTDTVSDVPAPLVFKSAKVGKDFETQLNPSDLFSFDEHVLPIVDVLAIKVLEQAILETMEEQELNSLKEEENALEEARRAESLRLNRLRARQQEVRRQTEEIVEEGRDNELKAMNVDKSVVGPICCAKGYIGGMVAKMVAQFRQQGHLPTTATDEGVTQSFLPWLNGMVEKSSVNFHDCYSLIDDVIRTVVHTREANIVNDVVAPPNNPPTSENDDDE